VESETGVIPNFDNGMKVTLGQKKSVPRLERPFCIVSVESVGANIQPL